MAGEIQPSYRDANPKPRKRKRNAPKRRGRRSMKGSGGALTTIGLLVGVPIALAGVLMFAAKRKAMKAAAASGVTP